MAVAAEREKITVFALKSRDQIEEEMQTEGGINPNSFMPIMKVSLTIHHLARCHLVNRTSSNQVGRLPQRFRRDSENGIPPYTGR